MKSDKRLKSKKSKSNKNTKFDQREYDKKEFGKKREFDKSLGKHNLHSAKDNPTHFGKYHGKKWYPE